MLRNYLKVTLRNLRRDKGYSITNIVGLSVGFACCLLIVLFVRHELSYDRGNANAERIFRVQFDLDGSNLNGLSAVPLPVAGMMVDQFTEIEKVAQVGIENEALIEYNNVAFYEDLYKSEPSLFDIFDLELLSGSVSGLSRPNTIVISQSIASKYFGQANPVGETISKGSKWDGAKTPYEVVGVIVDPPKNSHFHPHLIASNVTDAGPDGDNWMRIAFTYVLLRPSANVSNLDERFAPVNERVSEAFNAEASGKFVPLLQIHLYQKGERDIEPQGDIRYIWLFSAIAFLILVIACINYMNLSTARAASRAREVGVRKVSGARQGQLAMQFIGEAVLQSLFALIIGIGLARLFLPTFNKLMMQPLDMELGSARLGFALVVIAIFVGVIAGSYPALVLSRLRPSAVLKGTTLIGRNSLLRKTLVVVQFAISAFLIAGTVVIQKQLQYVQSSRLGFDAENVVVVSARNSLGTSADGFKGSLLMHNSISHVSLAAGVPGEGYRIAFVPAENVEAYNGSAEMVVGDWVLADHDFADALGLVIVAGRNLSERFPTDSSDAIVVNETAVTSFGWDDPIGKTIDLGEGKRTVVGVVRDFHLLSMKEQIQPLFLQLRPPNVFHVVVKLTDVDVAASINDIRDTWEAFVPGQPLSYSFLDDNFAAMYRTETRLGRLFTAFSILGIFVACLGSYGLAAFTAENRTKEIGIRKVLGASVVGLMTLLAKDLVKLVAVAVVIVIPLVYLGAERWLEKFAYRVDLSWNIFLFTAALSILIAVATVTLQSAKVAFADPVRSLRHE